MKKIILLLLVIISITGCKDQWQYDFIKATMDDPENIFEYSMNNDIVISEGVTQHLHDKNNFINFIFKIKRLNNQKWSIKVDKIEDHFHRIKISNKENTECINFYFDIASGYKRVDDITLADNRIDPEDIKARGSCDPD